MREAYKILRSVGRAPFLQSIQCLSLYALNECPKVNKNCGNPHDAVIHRIGNDNKKLLKVIISPHGEYNSKNKMFCICSPLREAYNFAESLKKS